MSRAGVRVAGVLVGILVLVVAGAVMSSLTGGGGPGDPTGRAAESSTASAPASSVPATTQRQTTQRQTTQRQTAQREQAPQTPAVVPVPSVSDAVRAGLPRATTFGTVSRLERPRDADSDGHVVRIARDQVGFTSPGGAPATVIPGKQIGLDTWLPIVERRSGWLRVRLPSKPNGSVTWIPAAGLRTAQTDWRVRINLGEGTMTVTKAGAQKGRWPIGQGMDATPTPVGQTFLLAGFVDPAVTYSPAIYALGAHSDTLDTFGGGPGTVAVHGWPTVTGRSGKISHGCVRVPAAALSIFGKLPTGTPVDIVAA